MLTEFGPNIPRSGWCRWREGIFRHALAFPNLINPIQKNKESGKPDSPAGARLHQQTVSLGVKCASPGGFRFIGTPYKAKKAAMSDRLIMMESHSSFIFFWPADGSAGCLDDWLWYLLPPILFLP